jgi:hypothetical protein
VSGSAAIPQVIAASSSGVLRISFGCLLIAFNLAVIGFAQANDPERLAALRENDAVEAGADYGIADLAQLSIVVPIVGRAPYGCPVDSFRDAQGDTVLPLVDFVLGLIEGRFHRLL